MTTIEELNPELKGLGRYEYGWADKDTAGSSAQRGLSEAVVAGRLKQLYADGIVDRRPYREAGKRTRDEYVLTERGRGIFPVIVAMVQWGEGLRDDHRTGVELVHRDCGTPLSVAVTCEKGHEVPVDRAAVRLKDEEHALAGRRRGLV